eukprot:PITA_32457
MYTPDYQKDFNLYLAITDTTISMVLVQEDNGIEHPLYYLSCNLNDTESKYSYVEKLGLAVVQAVQRIQHYILFHKTTILSDCNPMTYILSRQLLGGKYSKWIAILQDFDRQFTKSKSKKSLVFTELLCDLPSSSNDLTSKASIVDETLFLISSSNPWYGDIIIYLQTQTFRPNTSRFEQRHIRYQAKDYMIVGDTLYCRGVNTVLRRCLTLEEAEKFLNDCHLGVCGGHQSSYTTTQKILRDGCFWPTIFKDCIIAFRSFHACQIFYHKTRLPSTLLHPVVVVGSFVKWGIDLMTCNPTLAGGAWAIVTDHGLQFCNHMMVELTTKLRLSHDSSTPYYLTSVKNATRFTPFQLVYGLEAILPIQCEISSLMLAIDLLPENSEEEARFLELIHLDETCRNATLDNEAHKKRVKA